MGFCFSTFEIRSLHTQKCVDYNELDKLICEKFDLKFSNEDYGHFPFYEGEMHQKSISLQTQDRCIESLFNPYDTKIMNCIVF